MKKIILITGFLILAFVAFFYFKKIENKKNTFEVGVANASDHIKGLSLSTSSVVIIEYSDFECPACRIYYAFIKELLVQFGDKVTFVFRNFPLTMIHKNAEAAAWAAEAAGKQGKFWEMHDLLFEKQTEWAEAEAPETYFYSYAKLLGISIEQFKIDFVSKEIRDLVEKETNEAIQAELSSTPTFFINGEWVENPGSVEDFEQIILNILDKQK